MSRFRLKENHPTSKKLEKLFDYMSEHKISFEINRMGQMEITDGDVVGMTFLLSDLESYSVTSLPPVFEYKITFNKE